MECCVGGRRFWKGRRRASEPIPSLWKETIYAFRERERDITKKWIDLEVEHVYQSSIQLWDVPGSWIVFLKEHFESIQRERQRKRGKE